MRNIILASGSRHRKMLLERLQLPFTQISPDIDESKRPNESVQEYVRRLAQEKCHVVAKTQADAIVIAGDQTVTVNGHDIVGKPHTRENAMKMLASLSGQCARFINGICIYDTRQQIETLIEDETQVYFRTLTQAEIAQYLSKEDALDCAGALRSECLGIALCERIVSQDPTSLVGLPLTQVVKTLKRLGLAVI